MSRLPVDAEIRAREIVKRLKGTWSDRSRKGICLCPAHNDGSPSLSVQLGERAILFKCFAGCTREEILKALSRLRLHDSAPLAMPAAAPSRDFTSLALNLWRNSRPVAGTLAEQYLLARGIPGPFPPVLRFHPKTIIGSGADRQILPALVAAVENAQGVIAVQRTFLDSRPLHVLRKPLKKSKVALGLLGDGAIRLAPAGEELGVAEGIEDALSAMAWFGTPTWALGGVERLRLFAIPPSVRRLIVYGDPGPAAARLIQASYPHLSGNGRHVEVRIPEARFQGMDWNAAWNALQSEGTQP